MNWNDYQCSLDGCEAGQNDKKLGCIEERTSMGVYAGKYHDSCWKKSGYRDVPESAFDPGYAGERMDSDY